MPDSKNATNLYLLASPLLFLILSFASCSSPRPADVHPGASAVKRHSVSNRHLPPVFIADIDDRSFSGIGNEVPCQSAEEFVPLVAVVKARGGKLAVIRFGSKPSWPPVVLRITPPPIALKPPVWSADPFERAEQREEFDKQRDRYTSALRQWKKDSDKEVNAFQDGLNRLFAQPLDPHHSAVFAALREGLVWLTQPDPAWAGQPERIVVGCTDGENNLPPFKLSMPASVCLLIVNGTGTVGSLSRFKHTIFSSLPAAARWIEKED